MQLIKAFGDESLFWEEQPRAVRVCFELFGGRGAGSEMLSAYDTLLGLTEAVKEYHNWSMTGSASERAFGSLCFDARGRAQEQFMKQSVALSNI